MILILKVIIELMLLIFVMFLLNFVIIYLHELGHAIGYYLTTRDNNWCISIGTGKTLFKSKKLELNLFMWIGHFYPIKENINTRIKAIIMLAGGPMMSIIILIILLYAQKNFHNYHSIISDSALNFLYQFAYNLNLFALIFSLIPMKSNKDIFNHGTDCYHIIRLLKKWNGLKITFIKNKRWINLIYYLYA